jgi:hypothetical protein
MSMRSTRIFIASAVRYMSLFQSIGTFTFNDFIPSTMVWRFGVGSPPTRLTLAAPSSLRIFIVEARSFPSTVSPFRGY